LVASGSQPANGQFIRVINYGSGVVTIARSGQNINGGTSSLSIPAASATAPTGAWITSDGTNYFANLFGASSSGSVTGGTKTCTNQALTVLTNDTQAVPTGTCATITSAYVDSSILTTSNTPAFPTTGGTDGSGSGLIAYDAAGGTLSALATQFVSQTDGATVTWAIGSTNQASGSLTFTTHGGSRTLNITGAASGGHYNLKLVQDGTGGEGLTLGTGCTWKVAGGGSGAITLTNSPGAIDVLSFTYDGTNCLAILNANFS
jgi:hypothetical protein